MSKMALFTLKGKEWKNDNLKWLIYSKYSSLLQEITKQEWKGIQI
jgi:hypothetical protein